MNIPLQYGTVMSRCFLLRKSNTERNSRAFFWIDSPLNHVMLMSFSVTVPSLGNLKLLRDWYHLDKRLSFHVSKAILLIEPGYASSKDAYRGFSAGSNCRRLYCLISTIFFAPIWKFRFALCISELYMLMSICHQVAESFDVFGRHLIPNFYLDIWVMSTRMVCSTSIRF